MPEVSEVESAEAVVTWTDLAAAARHRAVRSKVWVLIVPLALVGLLLAVIGPAVVVQVIGVLLLAYFATAPLWGPTTATWVQARRRTWTDHPTRWQVTGEGIAIESEAGRQTLPWESLTEVTPWRRGVSLTYGRAVAFIPQRAFSSPAHSRAFSAAARSRAGLSGP